jgi:hypothetical protein
MISFSREMNSKKARTQFFDYIQGKINPQLWNNLIKGKCRFLIILHAGEEYTTAGESVHVACIPDKYQSKILEKYNGHAIILRRRNIDRTSCKIHSK